MSFTTAHEQARLADHPGERLPRGLGLAIGAVASAGLWALLIHGAIRLFG